MIYDNEITVEVDLDILELKNILTKNNFIIKEEYDVNDIYMFDKKCEVTSDYLEILKHCILIRNVIKETKNIKEIVYKYKEYNEKKEIIKQGKVSCYIENIKDAKTLFEILGYSKLIEIHDHLMVYTNGKIEFAVQLVNDKHIYIEIEEENNLKYGYRNLEEIKKEFNKYNIPIKNNDYFVKKAEIKLSESLNN